MKILETSFLSEYRSEIKEDSLESYMAGIKHKLLTKDSLQDQESAYYYELIARFFAKKVREEIGHSFSVVNTSKLRADLLAEDGLDDTKKFRYSPISKAINLTKLRLFFNSYDTPNERKDSHETIWDMAQELWRDKGLKLHLGHLHKSLPTSLKSKYGYIDMKYDQMAIISGWLEDYETPNTKKDSHETIWDLAQKIFKDKGVKLHLGMLYTALPPKLKKLYGGRKLSFEDMESVSGALAGYESPNETKDSHESLWDATKKINTELETTISPAMIYSAMPEGLRSKYSQIAMSYKDLLIVSKWLGEYVSPNTKRDSNETLWDLAQKLGQATKKKPNLAMLYTALPANLKSLYRKTSLSYKDMESTSLWLSSYQSPNVGMDSHENLWNLTQNLCKEQKIELRPSTLYTALPPNLKELYSYIDMSYEDISVISVWLEEYESPNREKDSDETIWDVAQNLHRDTGLKANLGMLGSALPSELKSKYGRIRITYEDMSVISAWLKGYETPNTERDSNETLWDLTQKCFSETGIKVNLQVMYETLPLETRKLYTSSNLSYDQASIVSNWLCQPGSIYDKGDPVETTWAVAQKLYIDKGLKINLREIYVFLPPEKKSICASVMLNYEDMVVVYNWLKNYRSPNNSKDEQETIGELAAKLSTNTNVTPSPLVLHSALPKNLKKFYSCGKK